MQVIENAGIDTLSNGIRAMLTEIANHCRPYQLLRTKPIRYLFPMKDTITGEFNQTLQVDVITYSA